MMTIILTILILFRIITYLIILDVILSWVSLIWLNLRPKILSDIIDPIYNSIKKVIPTTIWPFDLTPIVVFILISFFSGLIFVFFPESMVEFNKITNYF